MAKRGRAWTLERTVMHRRGQAPRSNRERIGYWSDFVGGRPVPKGTPLSARRRDGLARVLGTFADAWPREASTACAYAERLRIRSVRTLVCLSGSPVGRDIPEHRPRAGPELAVGSYERAPRLESATRSPAAPDRARRSGARGGPVAGRRQRDAVQAGSSRRPRPRQRRGKADRDRPLAPPLPQPQNRRGQR